MGRPWRRTHGEPAGPGRRGGFSRPVRWTRSRLSARLGSWIRPGRITRRSRPTSGIWPRYRRPSSPSPQFSWLVRGCFPRSAGTRRRWWSSDCWSRRTIRFSSSAFSTSGSRLGAGKADGMRCERSKDGSSIGSRRAARRLISSSHGPTLPGGGARTWRQPLGSRGRLRWSRRTRRRVWPECDSVKSASNRTMKKRRPRCSGATSRNFRTGGVGPKQPTGRLGVYRPWAATRTPSSI